MTISVVLADANILFSRTLRDYVLYAAAEGAIEVHWSQQILDEMSKNLRGRLGISRFDTARLEQLMNDYLEHSLVDIDPDAVAVAQGVGMSSGDRHVLAAALSCDADTILTENIRHFPREWMAEHGLELLRASDLLIRLAESSPDALLAAHALVLRFSSKSESEVFATLERAAGQAAADAIRRIRDDGR